MALTAKNILVGYDGSDAAKLALETAADLAGYGSTITVATVSGPRYPEVNDEIPRPYPVPNGGRLLAEARNRLALRHVVARTIEPIGEPVDELVDQALRLDADLLVVGSRGGASGRVLLGSVSAGIVLRAPCDVLVVRRDGTTNTNGR